MPPTSPFGSKFSFEPEGGHLSGGEIQIIRVRLMSDLLGSFSEAFEWTIQGSSVPLMLQLKGNVTGPTYEVDTTTLDFGVVSYGFRWGFLGGPGGDKEGIRVRERDGGERGKKMTWCQEEDRGREGLLSSRLALSYAQIPPPPPFPSPLHTSTPTGTRRSST